MVSSIGAPTLISVLERPEVTATYSLEGVGTSSQTVGNVEEHRFVAFQFMGDKTKATKSEPRRLQIILERQGLSSRVARLSSRKISKLAPSKLLSSDHFCEGGVINQANEDIRDEAFLTKAVSVSIADLSPNFETPIDLFVKSIPRGENFIISTNIDFEKLNQKKKKGIENITAARLVTNILSARTDLVLSSHYGADFQTSRTNSEIMRIKHSQILRYMDRGISDKDAFQEILLGDTRALKNAIDSNIRTFDEFLILLDKATKFRKWFGGLNPDEKAIRAYIEELGRSDWLESLPIKASRFVFGTVIGFSDPSAGLATSVADSFILEKLLGGWRPNHFVTKKLQPFVSDE